MSTGVIERPTEITESDWRWPSRPDDDPVLVILRRALAALQEHGWSKGRYIQDDGSMCLLGALHFAASGSLNFLPADTFLEVCSEILLVINVRHYSIATPRTITRWNDSPWRRKRQVMAALQQAIRNREEQHVHG